MKELLEGLADLYSSLNHGDDERLLALVKAQGYTFECVNFKYIVVPYTDEMKKEDEEWENELTSLDA